MFVKSWMSVLIDLKVGLGTGSGASSGGYRAACTLDLSRQI